MLAGLHLKFVKLDTPEKLTIGRRISARPTTQASLLRRWAPLRRSPNLPVRRYKTQGSRRERRRALVTIICATTALPRPKTQIRQTAPALRIGEAITRLVAFYSKAPRTPSATEHPAAAISLAQTSVGKALTVWAGQALMSGIPVQRLGG
jgi:hypothetical protein